LNGTTNPNWQNAFLRIAVEKVQTKQYKSGIELLPTFVHCVVRLAWGFYFNSQDSKDAVAWAVVSAVSVIATCVQLSKLRH
jgi:hypothetical protein